jgi:hypothetical protein
MRLCLVAAIVLAVLHVSAAYNPAAADPAALQALCMAFQAAQNSLNGTAAGLLFTPTGVSEVPAGSTPNVGPVCVGLDAG